MDIVSVPLVIHGVMDTIVVKFRLPNGTGVDEFLFGAKRNPPLMYCMAFSKEMAGAGVMRR